MKNTYDIRFIKLKTTNVAPATVGVTKMLIIDEDGLVSFDDIPAGGGVGSYTDEEAQDAVGSILSAEFTYSDTTPSIVIASIAASKITQSTTRRFITDTERTNWQVAYDDHIVSAAFSGTSTKTLTLTQQDGGTITATFTDDGGGLSGLTDTRILYATGASTVGQSADLIFDHTNGQIRFFQASFETGYNFIVGAGTSSIFKGDVYIGTNKIIQMGSGALYLGNATVDPPGASGGLYYNTSSNKLRTYENGAWVDVIGVGGGGGVTSVGGTANRITSSGGVSPIIDIASTYIGQTSITTLGTIIAGTWNAGAVTANAGSFSLVTDDTVNVNGLFLHTQTGTAVASLSTYGAIWVDPSGVLKYLYNGSNSDVVLTSGNQTISGVKSFNADVFHLDGNGVVIGHNAQLTIGGIVPEFQMLGTTATDSTMVLGRFSTTNSDAPEFVFFKGGDAAIGTATVVSSGEVIGKISALGQQQTGTFATQNIAAQIRFEIDNTVTSGAGGDMPGRIVFATTPNGSGTPVDRIRITSASTSGVGIMEPCTNGGMNLGSASGNQFASLYLLTGGEVSFGGGNVRLLHSNNLLTIIGNNVRIGALDTDGTAPTQTGSVYPVTTDGNGQLSFNKNQTGQWLAASGITTSSETLDLITYTPASNERGIIHVHVTGMTTALDGGYTRMMTVRYKMVSGVLTFGTVIDTQSPGTSDGTNTGGVAFVAGGGGPNIVVVQATGTSGKPMNWDANYIITKTISNS